jgi:molecular chaperone DnaJ
MKVEDCYSTLGLSPNASDDDAKKKYRELSKQWHPDVNKSPEAPEKFKKINEAYDRIKNKNFDQDQVNNFGGFGGFGGFNFNIEDLINFHRGDNKRTAKNRNHLPIETSISISFKESIFGCKKELNFDRNVKCQSCSGEGSKFVDNGCKLCHGMGKVTSQRGNMVFTTTCPQCKGKTSFEDCKDCSGNGHVTSNTNISVNIPAGISNNTLRLVGIGNYVGNNPFGDNYSDVYVHVHVIEDNNFQLQENDVISQLSISLLDALQGCDKTIITLDGEMEIAIPAMSKNKEEIIIPNLGVGRQGNQRVILSVEYPQDCNKLISFLKEIS